jgi:hypothetical protein
VKKENLPKKLVYDYCLMVKKIKWKKILLYYFF